jgi:hypothetical protein
MSARRVNLLVFREGRRDISASALKTHLYDRLRYMEKDPSREEILGLLLLAGELECGVADVLANETSAPHEITETSDALAGALLANFGSPSLPDFAELLESTSVPARVSVSAPEGFAYYALHPLAYANIVSRLPLRSRTVAVIGIRSIGTTLSAVVAACLRQQGKDSSRITVRPQGHPYNRELPLSDAELEFVHRHISEDAEFLVVDEGPGLSGSSFLAVAEALTENGVPREKITLICGHQPNFETFRSDNGAERARKYLWLAVDNTPRLPKGTGAFLGGGQWRRHFFSNESDWPETWTSFERLKYQSSDLTGNPRFHKFLGFGHYGEAALAREQQVASAGFGPKPRREENGFASYPLIQGRPMRAADLNQATYLNADILARLADYCAFRAREFPAELNDLCALQLMADHNLRELAFDVSVQLELKRPAIADGRMQPHEWLINPDGKILKTDSGCHGDDHFFPGPTDIAWDLAGAIVEWEMNPVQEKAFLELYRCASEDDASSRIQHFIAAYCAFRAAYCLMAANALGESEESRRFGLAAARYKLAIPVSTSTSTASVAA